MEENQKNNTEEKQDNCIWYDGKNVYEVSFCNEFLAKHPMKFIEGVFYNTNGAVDIQKVRKMIADRLLAERVQKDFAKKVNALTGALQSICYAPDFEGSDNEIHLLNGILTTGFEFKPNVRKICRNRLNVRYVRAIKGNHEVMAVNALKRVIDKGGKRMGVSTLIKTLDDMKLWFRNGGEVSLAQYMNLSPEDSKKVWDYMLDLPLYRELSVEGKEYVLVHGGLEHFTKNRKLSDYSTNEMVWSRPELGTRYYPDKTVVVGHTPTFFYGICSKTNCMILKTDSFIDVDCGCVYGGRLGCLCLDTGEEFYL